MQFENISNNDKRSCQILKLYSTNIGMIISLNQRKTDTESQVRFTTSHELVLKWHNAFLSQVRTLLLACFSPGTYLEGTTVSPLLSSHGSLLYRVRQHRHAYFTLVAASYADDYPGNLFALTIARNRSFNYHSTIVFIVFPRTRPPCFASP